MTDRNSHSLPQTLTGGGTLKQILVLWIEYNQGGVGGGAHLCIMVSLWYY